MGGNDGRSRAFGSCRRRRLLGRLSEPQHLRPGPVRRGGLREPPPSPPRPETHPADDELLVQELVASVGAAATAKLLRAFGGFDVPLLGNDQDAKSDR